MNHIRIATEKDISFLSEHDKHIEIEALRDSIFHQRILVAENETGIIGWLRYNLFWDNTPFVNMLFVLEKFRGQGYGKMLMQHFEKQMLGSGYTTVMTSTLVNEDAIHFYLKLGYEVVGGFHPSAEEYEIVLKKNCKTK